MFARENRLGMVSLDFPCKRYLRFAGCSFDPANRAEKNPVKREQHPTGFYAAPATKVSRSANQTCVWGVLACLFIRYLVSSWLPLCFPGARDRNGSFRPVARFEKCLHACVWPCLFVPGDSPRVLPFRTAKWLSACPVELHQSPRSLGSWPGVVPELGFRAQPKFSLSARGSVADRAPLTLFPSLGPGFTLTR